MSKLLISLSCCLLMMSSANAELPDFTEVWKDLSIGKLEQADKEIDKIWTTYEAAMDRKLWENPFSQASSKDVEEWLHFGLMKLYVAYLRKDDNDMKKLQQNIENLSYLEFMGKNQASRRKGHGR